MQGQGQETEGEEGSRQLEIPVTDQASGIQSVHVHKEEKWI